MLMRKVNFPSSDEGANGGLSRTEMTLSTFNFVPEILRYSLQRAVRWTLPSTMELKQIPRL